jgi:hypothetical protein
LLALKQCIYNQVSDTGSGEALGKFLYEIVIVAFRLRLKFGNDWASIGAALGRSASSVKDKFRLMKETCNSGMQR